MAEHYDGAGGTPGTTQGNKVGPAGSFDGIYTRTVRGYMIGGNEVQDLVSSHESWHAELQCSTIWGLTTLYSYRLAAAGFRSGVLYRVARQLSTMSLNVHELMASYLSEPTDPASRAFYAENPIQMRYWNEAARLVPSSPDIDIRMEYIWFFLRGCMASRALSDLMLRTGFTSIRTGDVARLDSPDDALKRSTALIESRRDYIANDLKLILASELPRVRKREMGHNLFSRYLECVGVATLDGRELEQYSLLIHSLLQEVSPTVARELRFETLIDVDEEYVARSFQWERFQVRKEKKRLTLKEQGDDTYVRLVKYDQEDAFLTVLWLAAATLHEQFTISGAVLSDTTTILGWLEPWESNLNDLTLRVLPTGPIALDMAVAIANDQPNRLVVTTSSLIPGPSTWSSTPDRPLIAIVDEPLVPLLKAVPHELTGRWVTEAYLTNQTLIYYVAVEVERSPAVFVQFCTFPAWRALALWLATDPRWARDDSLLHASYLRSGIRTAAISWYSFQPRPRTSA